MRHRPQKLKAAPDGTAARRLLEKLGKAEVDDLDDDDLFDDGELEGFLRDDEEKKSWMALRTDIDWTGEEEQPVVVGKKRKGGFL